MVKTDVVERQVQRVTCEKTVNAMLKMKLGKTAGKLEVSMEIIYASSVIGFKVIMDLC